MKLLVLAFAGCAAIVILAVVAYVIAIQLHIHRMEARVTDPAVYTPSAKAIALLCQSDPFFFLDEPPFRPAWTPPEVLRLDPTWVEITADHARVEFGGGFHHFGYDLELDKTASDKSVNVWTLNFYSEDSATRPLIRITLNKADHVDEAQFVQAAMVEFLRRVGQSNPDGGTVTERLTFLLKFDEVQLARKSIRNGASANPNDWGDQLLAYLIDAKVDPTATERLDAWARQKDDFSAWLLAAYAYDFAGDDDSAERCTKAALARPVDDPDWIGTNARYRGATMCARLLVARRYGTCDALCDALLSYAGSGDYLAPEITAIRDVAQHAPAGGADVPPLGEGSVFDPFKGIDVSRLMSREPASLPTSRPQGSASSDRMAAYYDHRISADPSSRSNYVDKIKFLLSIHKQSDALDTCRIAARVFPDWWRPPVAIAMLADADSRQQAELQLRGWVEAHPAFIHWWYLAHFYQGLGRDSDAMAALQSAVKYPLENVDDDETLVPAAYAYDAARYAYSQGQFNLVLDVTRVWAAPRGIYNYFDDDIYAFRAAAELALGQFAAAKKDADLVTTVASEHAIWAGHLSELQQAANARNQSFRYDPGTTTGGDWVLF